MKEYVVASTMIKDLDKMSKTSRKRIAKWLRSRADWVENHGDLAASTFRQKFIVTSKDKWFK